ncbi:peptidylprolyl isomerase [Psychrobacillus sp. NPDC058041]|uniref:peptidylprolyl isomerase n=1 Tax=Psychrobacillus sp. NPDC058041 TaxID=3346310 RepID=UPI0036D9BE42
MKKLFLMIFLVLSILSACNSSKLNLSEIDGLSNELQDKVDSNLRLQSINVKNGSYIIFHSSGEVEVDLDTQGNTIIIKFNVRNSKDDVVKQHIYYLTTDSNHDVIDVQVDGESIPFDVITT